MAPRIALWSVAAALLVSAPSPARTEGLAIEPATAALARLDSLQAIVRIEETRVRHAPGDEAGWTRLARAWFQVGDQAKAAKCLERARSVGGREFDTALLSGRIARSEGRLEEAIQWLEHAARMRPDDWEAREDLGLAYYQAGRDADAADEWQRARALPTTGSPDRSGWLEALRRAGNRSYQVTGRGSERLRFLPQPLRGPLVVMARINGRGPFLLRIDVGSPEMVLHQSLARELGLGIIPGAAAGAAAGTGVALDYAVVDSLTLGSTTLRRMAVAVSADPRLGRAGEPRGLLGFEALRRFRFCIDLGDSTLWLDPAMPLGSPADSAPPEWASGARVHRVPVLLRGTHLLIATGRLNQGPDRPFLLDATGTGTSFSGPISTLAEAGIAPDSTRALTGTSAAGSVPLIAFPITRLCIADACRDSLEGTYGTFPPRLERNPSFRLAGIVSGGFLTHYRIGIDATRREVWLVER